MTDVERRLRAGLTGLADELAPSPDAWAEQQHRQQRAARHRRGGRPHRRPLVALAAAAVVLAVGVVPAAITRPAPSPGGPSERSGITYDPSPEGPYLSVTDGPVRLGEFTEAGRRWAASVFVERHPEGTGWAYRLCVVGVAPGRPVTDPDRYPTSSAGCVPVPDWPAGRPGELVRTRPVLGGSTPASGPLPGLLLFLTSPEVAKLEARSAFGAPVPVRELGRNSALALFLGEFGASYQGFGYVARDSAGRVVEQAIS
jgi:hypothetical protein